MLPLVIRVNRQGQVQQFAFADSPVRIGRSPLNHLVLSDHFVSRIQAIVRFDANEVTYFNVGHTNTTLVDGVPVATDTEVTLTAQTVLSIGTLELRFTREAVDEAKILRPATASTDEGGAASLAQTMFHRPQTGRPQPAPQTAPLETARLGDEARGAHQDPPSARPPGSTDAQSAAAPQRRAEPAKQSFGAASVVVVSASSPPVVVQAGRFARVGTESAEPQTPASQPSPDWATPRPASPATQAPAAAREGGGGPSARHAEYRSAWQALCAELSAQLEATPEHQRPAIAERMQRDYPQIVRENDFRQLLARFGLKPLKPGDPELEAWLRGLGKGLFPAGVRLDTGMTVERVGQLLEKFSEVFVEIQAAQIEAREAMGVPVPSAASLLSSEDPKIILAYLLNPNVDGKERLAELEQCVTKLALHEAALFGAVKDGAQSLLEEIAPSAIEAEESRESGSEPGAFARVFGSKQDAGDAKLWRRYAAKHADLADGKQFQRRFVGRSFARFYLRAMEKLAGN